MANALEVISNGRAVSTDLSDLNKLGKRAQKNKLLQKTISAYTNMMDVYNEANECKMKAKNLRKAIKNSEAGKKLDEVSKRANFAFKKITVYAHEIETIKECARELGLDITAEIKNIKLLEE